MYEIKRPTNEEVKTWREAYQLASKLEDMKDEIQEKLEAFQDFITKDVPVWVYEFNYLEMTEAEIDKFFSEKQ